MESHPKLVEQIKVVLHDRLQPWTAHLEARLAQNDQQIARLQQDLTAKVDQREALQLQAEIQRIDAQIRGEGGIETRMSGIDARLAQHLQQIQKLETTIGGKAGLDGVKQQLSDKVDLVRMEEALRRKADKDQVLLRLAEKVDNQKAERLDAEIQRLERGFINIDGLEERLDIIRGTLRPLAGKVTYLEQSIKDKVEESDLQRLLATKANLGDMLEALHVKVDLPDLQAFKEAVARSFDGEGGARPLFRELEQQLQLFFEQLARVEQSLPYKVDNTIFQQALLRKVDIERLEQHMQGKADVTFVRSALEGKLDKTQTRTCYRYSTLLPGECEVHFWTTSPDEVRDARWRFSGNAFKVLAV